MTARRSAGLLVHRSGADGGVEVLIGHLGGPLWARKDDRAWTIPKGEHADDEDPLAAARREFREELGIEVPAGPAVELGEVRQRGGKVVRAWAVRGDVDLAAFAPGTFTMEWPPRSGVRREFPELDRVGWVPRAAAERLLVTAQVEFLVRLDALGPG